MIVVNRTSAPTDSSSTLMELISTESLFFSLSSLAALPLISSYCSSSSVMRADSLRLVRNGSPKPSVTARRGVKLHRAIKSTTTTTMTTTTMTRELRQRRKAIYGTTYLMSLYSCEREAVSLSYLVLRSCQSVCTRWTWLRMLFDVSVSSSRRAETRPKSTWMLVKASASWLFSFRQQRRSISRRHSRDFGDRK